MRIAVILAGAAFAALAMGPSAAQAQQCPAGAMPGMDNFGHPVCKRV